MRQVQIIDMIKMDIKGVSRTEIARQFGVTKGRVSQILNAPQAMRIKAEMSKQIQSTINRVAAKMKAQAESNE